MALSQEAYFRGVPTPTTLRTPYPSEGHFFVCPLALAQLRAVICHCGDPVDCRNIPFRLQAHSADPSMNGCIMSCGLAEPDDFSMTRSSVDLQCPDKFSSAALSETATADAEKRAQGARTAVKRSRTRSLSGGRTPCTEGSLWYTGGAASARSNLLVDGASRSPCAFSARSVRTHGTAETVHALRGRSGCPDAAVVQQLKPRAGLSLLCCTRWKHTLTAASRSSERKTMCSSIEAGKAEYSSGTSKTCSASTTPKDRRVVCGLLVYEGQRFFEGRLLHEHLNNNLCWNDATWKRLYYSLTEDARSAVSPFTPEAPTAGAVVQPYKEADKGTALPGRLAKSVSRSRTSAGHGDRTLVVLHTVGSNEPQKETCGGPCVTTSSQNSHTDIVNERQRSTKKADAFNALESLECSVGVPDTSNTSSSGSRYAKWPPRSVDANTDMSATSRSMSPAREQPETTLPQRSSCSQAIGDQMHASCRPSRTYMPPASENRPANTYTLSLVMELGTAPHDMYVRIAGPIRLQPLTLAAGVAKLSTAVLLMQRLYVDEQQMMEQHYSACMEALRKTTEELAAAAAQRQKREDDLLRGACVLLNEKKRKLEALRRRVLLLEKKAENASATGSSEKARRCGASRRKSCRGGDSASEDCAAVVHTSLTPFSGAVQNGIRNGLEANSETVSRADIRTGSGRAKPALTGGHRSRKPLLATPPAKRAAFGEVDSPEPDVLEKCRLRRTGAAGLFLVHEKRLFPAAFACIRVKEEPLELSKRPTVV